ncbi:MULTISPECIES: hypothetical protein [Methylosinus]|uniref:Uncharacterized protein n=1 Tax=Methylosinus trichosporium (strain ATCC 35070 / NCIMB 11131 / UNIQEM 75 / OB3b) TaxID=595536 RepID=A0A2D2D5H7_METT3|nr:MULTISPECIES: hypothetical protein [Methylosinus]ATQ70215.1 hypothetical protein CQW49_03975 [Methylosinus trichosporium OB3b]OBS52760.1 hypothetical protein A8B73_09540 [Methylosinus sp. 3S-1]
MQLSYSAAWKWLAARMAEPSTWAGTGVVAALAHSIAPGVLGDSLITLGAAIGGVLAVVVPERRG